MLLWGISALVLLVGCVNLSGLLLARTAARDQQLVICFALKLKPSFIDHPRAQNLRVANLKAVLGLIQVVSD